eukprot:120134-Rhodomonas_salina.2
MSSGRSSSKSTDAAEDRVGATVQSRADMAAAVANVLNLCSLQRKGNGFGGEMLGEQFEGSERKNRIQKGDEHRGREGDRN